MMVVILTPVDGIIRWLPRGFSCSPALHGYTEAPGIVSFVEPDDDVIGVSDHYHIACGIATSPLMRPQIEDVVEVYVCQQR